MFGNVQPLPSDSTHSSPYVTKIPAAIIVINAIFTTVSLTGRRDMSEVLVFRLFMFPPPIHQHDNTRAHEQQVRRCQREGFGAL